MMQNNLNSITNRKLNDDILDITLHHLRPGKKNKIVSDISIWIHPGIASIPVCTLMHREYNSKYKLLVTTKILLSNKHAHVHEPPCIHILTRKKLDSNDSKTPKQRFNRTNSASRLQQLIKKEIVPIFQQVRQHS